MEGLNFALLGDYPHKARQVAQWWCEEWGLPERHSRFEDYVAELAECALGELPIHVVALKSGRLLGAATLKQRMSSIGLAPAHSYWLSGMYVDTWERGQGIGTALCEQITTVARNRSISRLYLQTESLDGGLYARLGWSTLSRVRLDGLQLIIMVKDLLTQTSVA